MKYLIPFIALIFVWLSPLVLLAQNNVEDIVVLKENELPADAKKMGKVKMLDGWRVDCGYAKTLDLVKEKASELGGNALVVTDVKKPDAWSTCYRIWANVFYISNPQAFLRNSAQEYDSIVRTIIADTASYSLLYAYRPRAFTGSLIEYNLHIDGDKVARISNNSIELIKLTKPSPAIIWARTEARVEEKINVEMGKIYFLECTVGMGIMVGQPRIRLVNNETGFGDNDLKEMQEMAEDLKKNDQLRN